MPRQFLWWWWVVVVESEFSDRLWLYLSLGQAENIVLRHSVTQYVGKPAAAGSAATCSYSVTDSQGWCASELFYL